MKRNWILALGVLLVVFASVSHAAIRRVGLNQTYTTLTAAYTAAVNDDTLLISPGVYSETITSTKRLHWIGAGYDEVTVNGRLILNAGSSGTRVEGVQFTISYSDAATGVINLATTVDLIEVKRCIIENSFMGSNYSAERCVVRTGSPGGSLSFSGCVFRVFGGGSGGIALVLNGDNLMVSNCIFAGLPGTGSGGGTVVALAGAPQTIQIVNTAFLGFSTVNVCAGSFPFTLQNSIAYDWYGAGNWGNIIQTASFNASSTIAPPGTDGILLAGDPFVNYDETANYIYGNSDLHLAAGSPCIDAGDPAILDLDGSRSDMGIYGGPTPHVDGGAPNYPFTIDLQVPSNMTAGQQLPIQATGRIGAGY